MKVLWFSFSVYFSYLLAKVTLYSFRVCAINVSSVIQLCKHLGNGQYIKDFATSF